MLLNLLIMLFDLLKDIQSNLAGPCYLGQLPSKEGIDAANGIYISLLSVNEGIQRPVLPVRNEYKNTMHSLDLYIVITAYNSNYEEGLRALDRVLQYFADNSRHSLPAQHINYLIHLANLTLEQNIALRQSVLAPGLPGIIYKVSTVKQAELTGD